MTPPARLVKEQDPIVFRTFPYHPFPLSVAGPVPGPVGHHLEAPGKAEMTAVESIWARNATYLGPYSAKFVPPALPSHWVRRHRLYRQLSPARQDRLTVVTGPPGAGKTVLLADWAHGGGCDRVAWFSVEPVDNDPGLFRRHLTAAFGLDLDGEALRADGGTHLEAHRFFAPLLRHMATEGPYALIIDDFHFITNPSIIGAVAALADQLPPYNRLVLAGEKGPQFPLQRLLSQGVASTLGEDDLRFTLEESSALVALAAGKILSLEDLRALTERTEGWAAGLYLAAEAMAREPDPAAFVRRFSGSFAPVAEYLEHEVLLRQPPDTVRFLLQTSVLGYLRANLCRAVSGRDDAGEILESLANNHFFVIPIGSRDRRYRYHRLFAQLLRSRLDLEDSSVGRQAHLGAGTWFEREGHIRSAVYHFAQAQAYDRAFALVVSDLGGPSDEVVIPQRATALRAQSPDAHTEDPRTIFLLAAERLSAMRAGEAVQLLRRIDNVTSEDTGRERWKGRVEFLWAVHAERLADAPGVLEHCRAANELMEWALAPRLSGCDAPGLDGSRLETIDAAMAARLPVLAARANFWLGEPDRAQEMLLSHFGTQDRAEASEPGILARIACRQGRLRDTYRLATAALPRGERSHGAGHLASFDSRLALAEALFEHNELEAALDQLESGLRLSRLQGWAHWSWAAETEAVRVIMAQNRVGEALNRLGRLRQVEVRDPPPHHLLRRLNEVEVGCRLTVGDLEGAIVIARSLAPGDLSPQTLARLDLSSGRAERALSRLASGVKTTVAGEIRRLVLMACAEMQQGRVQRADQTLRRAVEIGRPERYIRPFLEATAQTLPIIQGMVAAYPDPYLAQVLGQADPLAPTATVETPGTMLEPLTDRERQVLGYLATHLSQPQIAAAMYLSPNTIRTYVRAIFRKIGAASRADAVMIARVHGLL